jgi:hypothetical protein
VAARIAGGADVEDEVVIAEELQLMLRELFEVGQWRLGRAGVGEPDSFVRSRDSRPTLPP